MISAAVAHGKDLVWLQVSLVCLLSMTSPLMGVGDVVHVSGTVQTTTFDRRRDPAAEESALGGFVAAAISRSSQATFW
jgi:hypothetical protein